MHTYTHTHTLKLFTVLQSEDFYDSRDYAGSVKMSKRSLRWIKAAVVFFIINVIVIVIYCIVLVITKNQGGNQWRYN